MMGELELMLAARFPLIYVVSAEEEPAEEELLNVAKSRKSQIYFWDFARVGVIIMLIKVSQWGL